MSNVLKTFLMVLAVSLGGSGLAGAAEIRSTTSVAAATIYADRALINREGSVKLPAGAHIIIAENMPAGFNESSLRVQGSADAAVKIGAVEVKHIYLAELAQAAERDRAKALQAKRDERAMIEAEVTALQTRAGFIQRVAEAGAITRPQADLAKLDFAPEKWAQAWTALQTGMAETQKELAAKAVAIRKIDEDIAQLENNYRQVQTAQRERRDVYIRVEAKADTDFDFTLTYQTPGAWWRPVYDARLDTGKGELLLEQYGQVAQQTGEDWHNAALTLSTARPELGTEMPRLETWYIQTLREIYAQNAAFAAKRQAMNVAAAPVAAELSAVMDAADGLQELKKVKEEARADSAEVVVTDYSAEFKVPGRVDVKSISEPAKFFVGKQVMKAALYAQTTPRLGSQAYLFARIENAEKFPIIPGMAAKYRDGAFMGNAAMKLLRPGEAQGLSFGVDDRVKVDFQKVSQSQDNPTLMFVGDITVERAYKTKVKSLHETPISITVYDQYPVAGDPDIKTELLEDKTTRGFIKDEENRQGVLVWKGDYKPQEEKSFDVAFRVKYPKGSKVGGF
ncbi:MAG: mucoidy inhibitor MuiA family protein [Alphaproteobacteria bacterium]